MTLALIALAAALYFAWALVRAASAFDQAFNIEYTEENMNAIDKLKSVLCNHEGGVCIAGKDADREIIAESIGELERMVERLAALEKQEPVAVIGNDYQLFYVGSGPLAPLVWKHGLKVGSKLYAAPAASPDVEKLKALSVTNIMIDVVPGEDGGGHEVYAKSVDDVVTLLARLSEKAEEHESLKAELEAAMRNDWVTYNPLTATYDTPDGTSVAAELVDNVQCLADVLHVAQIRDKQRAEQAKGGA